MDTVEMYYFLTILMVQLFSYLATSEIKIRFRGQTISIYLRFERKTESCIKKYKQYCRFQKSFKMEYFLISFSVKISIVCALPPTEAVSAEALHKRSM